MADKAEGVLGMLYIVEVRMVCADTHEKIKQKMLVVGCENDDIERKLRWVFDAAKYRQFSITSVEKVREKIHVLSTTVTQDAPPITPVMARSDGTVGVPQMPLRTEEYAPKLFAVGIVTSILAKDEMHALRKVGNALIATGTDGDSKSAKRLGDDSQITIEEIPKSSGYAMPRDVSNESNKAHFVRG